MNDDAPRKHPDLLNARPAMIRAARNAAEIARQHGQPLALWRDGRIVHVMPEDLPELPDETPEETSE